MVLVTCVIVDDNAILVPANSTVSGRLVRGQTWDVLYVRSNGVLDGTIAHITHR